MFGHWELFGMKSLHCKHLSKVLNTFILGKTFIAIANQIGSIS